MVEPPQGARTDLIANRLNHLLAHARANTPGPGERYSIEDLTTRIDGAASREPISSSYRSRLLVEHSSRHADAVDALLARLESGQPIGPDWQPILDLAQQAGLIATNGQPTEEGIQRLVRRRRQDQLRDQLIKNLGAEDRPQP